MRAFAPGRIPWRGDDREAASMLANATIALNDDSQRATALSRRACCIAITST
jgi:hypothetical protein